MSCSFRSRMAAVKRRKPFPVGRGGRFDARWFSRLLLKALSLSKGSTRLGMPVSSRANYRRGRRTPVHIRQPVFGSHHPSGAGGPPP